MNISPGPSIKVTRILIADDHELVRQGITEILRRTHPEWEIAGVAADGREAIDMAEALRPDIAILDLSMPEFDGLQVTARLVDTVPEIKILLLTGHAAGPVMKQVRRAGANAFVAKNEVSGRLVEVLEQMVAGSPFFTSASASRPVSELGEHERVPVQYILTPRELEVLRQLARGLSNKEVAVQLGISVRTVEIHRANIMAGLAVDSLAEVVRLALKDGLA